MTEPGVDPNRDRVPRSLQLLVGALVVVGVLWRAAPLADADGRLMAQWPTEDGYFMLTMGRNVALGRGLSVAGGETPTNGTQPLTTLVWAAGYRLVGPDRAAGIFLALVLQLLASLATAYVIYRLARRAFHARPGARARGLLAAGLWVASPVAMPHTMNCLETGFYGLVAALVGLAFLDTEERPPLWSWRRTLGFGALLGLAFWVRNDSAFLIFAACVGYVWPGLRDRREELRGRLARTLAFGATSVVVASPWLVYNYVGFGHVMPVSGRAEALTGHFGGNLGGLPIVLAEYLGAIVPIPHAISSHPLVIALALVPVLGVAGWLVRARPRLSPGERRLAGLVAIYVAGLCAFYGLYFGAAWFLPRYFLPISPFFVLMTVSGLAWAYERAGALGPKLAPVVAVGAIAAMTFLSQRQYRQGSEHPHFQVVAWVRDNVPEDVWVGAIQTGTLGFFHDRTVNLDGKVNVAAYEALVARRQGEYVVEDTEIEYLADWIGMRDWLTLPVIASHFELIVEDEAANLAVLRRRARTP
ncbi:MAG: glycosyltransferase family 39 protein [Sandaracinaceae bacterium]|nr:glycosyltransferase family 39 protein [Sandaracinaceae bacterium]